MHVCLGDTAYFVAYCFSVVQKLLNAKLTYVYLPPGGNNFGSLLIRDGPLEKLWGRGRGIFEPQEFFFVIKFLV